MDTCIICRESKLVFSDEHVIPDALGGYYHIHTVCKECNSTLGAKVDSHLVNHHNAVHFRFLMGIKGKSKKIPNPFSGIYNLKNDENSQVILKLNDKGIPVPHTLPQIVYYEENGKKGANITIDKSDAKLINSISKKLAKKFQVSIEHIKMVELQSVRTEHPELYTTIAIDVQNFKIGLLKIAYEFAVDTIPDYFNDYDAIKISSILKNADINLINEYVNLGSGFDTNILSSVEKFIDLDAEKHFLILTNTDSNGLFCLIYLHKIFSIGVQLSKNSYSDFNTIIGINSIKNKEFRKVTLEDALNEILSPPCLRFLYFFESQEDIWKFQELEKNESFEFHKQNNDHILFTRNGKECAFSLEDKMYELDTYSIFEMKNDGSIFNTFVFSPNENLYIKVKPSGKLLRILAVRKEFSQIKKL